MKQRSGLFASWMFALLLMPLIALADEAPTYRTAAGDWGHFLESSPFIYVSNPKGEDFNFVLHQMTWIMLTNWTRKTIPVQVFAPDGSMVFSNSVDFVGTDGKATVKARGPGTYKLDVACDQTFSCANFWFECTLARSVVMAAYPGEGKVIPNSRPLRHIYVQSSAPRRWWFWVPLGTREFTCRAWRDPRTMSQREDWGITIFSPRGQRITYLWGQPRVWAEEGGRKNYGQIKEALVQIEPGTAGRFWAVELRLGDSHNYTDVNFSLEGVPPYLARSPEEWFDPETGKPPPVLLYDDAKFMQHLRDTNDQFLAWSPCPSLGDADGNMLRGDSRLALWNPDDRELRFAVADYLPRMINGKPPVGRISVARAGMTNALFDAAVSAEHFHEKAAVQPFPKTGKGEVTVDISGLKRFLFFTYPATPLVVMPKMSDGWERYELEVATARNYYFFVPAGTTGFEVRASASEETDVLELEVNAPDRTMAKLYDRMGTLKVTVPRGLDNKIWHVRLDVGSSTRMISDPDPDKARYQGMNVTLEFKGISTCLAPTWEQWFVPGKPVPAMDR